MVDAGAVQRFHYGPPDAAAESLGRDEPFKPRRTHGASRPYHGGASGRAVARRRILAGAQPTGEDVRDVKVLKESKTETGYVLEAVGQGGMGPGDAKGTISIVREGGKLKLDKESWKQ